MALLTLVWALLLIRYATGDAKWDSRARFLHAVAIATLPLVLVAAIVDARGFGFVTRPRWNDALIWHALAGLAVAGTTTWHFFWRRRYLPEEFVGRLAAADLIIASVSFWILVAAGLLAGEMVFAA